MSWKNKIMENLNEKGVSPVVGVILMVAITVILAAVIGTFVLGLGDQVQSSATAGVAFNDNGSAMDVTLNNVQNADEIYVDATSSDTSGISGGVNDGNYLLNESGGGAGTVVTVGSPTYEEGETVQVIGVLSGNENVIQDQVMG